MMNTNKQANKIQKQNKSEPLIPVGFKGKPFFSHAPCLMLINASSRENDGRFNCVFLCLFASIEVYP